MATHCDWPQLHPRAFISHSTDILHVSFGRPLLLFPAGVQRYSWNRYQWHSVNMPNPHPPFFTSNKMGSIPVRSWSSALVILFGQKMCRILLRHLFWNTSCMWHIPLVTFQDSASYSSICAAQYVGLENVYLCFLAEQLGQQQNNTWIRYLSVSRTLGVKDESEFEIICDKHFTNKPDRYLEWSNVTRRPVPRWPERSHRRVVSCRSTKSSTTARSPALLCRPGKGRRMYNCRFTSQYDQTKSNPQLVFDVYFGTEKNLISRKNPVDH